MDPRVWIPTPRITQTLSNFTSFIPRTHVEVNVKLITTTDNVVVVLIILSVSEINYRAHIVYL